jgi:hypothetical protein
MTLILANVVEDLEFFRKIQPYKYLQVIGDYSQSLHFKRNHLLEGLTDVVAFYWLTSMVENNS